MIISSARYILQMTETCRGIPAGLATRIGRYAPYALQKTIHTDVEVDATKKAFFDVFESDASARRKVVYSLSFADDSLENDLASDDTFPLLDDVMRRQLLNSYSTHSLPSSSTARQMRNKLPPHLNLSSLEPYDLDAKDSLPDLEATERSIIPSGYNQPLPKTVNDINPSILDQESRAIVVTDIKSPFLISQVNSSWENLCGYKRDECKGKSLGPLLQGPDTDWSAVSALLSHLFAGEEASAVLTNYAKNGRRFRNLLKVGPVRDEMGKTVNFVGVLHELRESGQEDTGKYDKVKSETAQLPFAS